MTSFTESEVEEAALAWLRGLGWRAVHGPAIAPDSPGAERDGYDEVVLARRLRDALAALNPDLPASAQRQRPDSRAFILDSGGEKTHNVPLDPL